VARGVRASDRRELYEVRYRLTEPSRLSFLSLEQFSLTFARSKLFEIIRLFRERPAEAWDRVSTAIELRLPDPDGKAPQVASASADSVGRVLGEFLSETVLSDLETSITEKQKRLALEPGVDIKLSADFLFSRFCYALCRAIKPKVVVETGVAYGVTSSFLLQALADNGQGELWSIDLPPFCRDSQRLQGILVPAGLRSRWHLLTGTSRRLLPDVLQSNPGGIDIFIHDSLHTRRNMLREFNCAWPGLNAVLVSDDVTVNSAFAEFVFAENPARSLVIHESGKDRMFGVAVKDKRVLSAL
jgi:predicted O-methyltransferase YrrM